MQGLFHLPASPRIPKDGELAPVHTGAAESLRTCVLRKFPCLPMHRRCSVPPGTTGYLLRVYCFYWTYSSLFFIIQLY